MNRVYWQFSFLQLILREAQLSYLQLPRFLLQSKPSRRHSESRHSLSHSPSLNLSLHFLMRHWVHGSSGTDAAKTEEKRKYYLDLWIWPPCRALSTFYSYNVMIINWKYFIQYIFRSLLLFLQYILFVWLETLLSVLSLTHKFDSLIVSEH